MRNRLFGVAPALALAAALAAAPSAHAFGPDDAGVYAIYDKNHKETDANIRFYLVKGKWIAEERSKGGPWTPFACDKVCEILPMTQENIDQVFGKAVNMVNPSCIANSHFAMCSYLSSSVTGSRGYLFMAQSPKGTVLLHVAQIEKM